MSYRAKIFQYITRVEPRITSFEETVQLDKWFVQHFNQARREKAKPHLYSQYFDIDALLLTQEENITIDKLSVNTNQPLFDKRRQQFTYPYFTTDEFHLLDAENITIDKWIREPILPRWDRERNQYIYQNLFFLDVYPEFIAFFTQGEVNISYVKEVQYQRFFFVEFETLPPEDLPVDKWLSTYPNKVYDFSREQFDYPIFFAPADLSESITVDKWFVQHFNRAIRFNSTPQFYPTFFNDSSPYFVRSRGFIIGTNKDTNTGIGVRGTPIIGRNKDTNTGIGTRKKATLGENNDTHTLIGIRNS